MSKKHLKYILVTEIRHSHPSEIKKMVRKRKIYNP